ncbi:uncharacterized protein LOC122856495 [Aphidius gifuensis]|uniref:uncharacterized protein LOC122856495 n=1 Tax=Aphidius gifuensis TaxID=684658 RepID=UPI001CDD2622|nr:uncharacterized protein LOC122856495 [Aphidius gifuensis]
MSEDSSQVIKKWIHAVTQKKLDGINEEINDYIIDYTLENHKKLLLNLLVNICQISGNINNDESHKYLQIYNLTKSICSKLTIIHNTDKYFSSIYYIVKKLLERKLFNEAKVLSRKFISEGTYFHAQSPEPSSAYVQFDSIWKKELKSYLLSLSERQIEDDIDELISYISLQINYKSLMNFDSSNYLLSDVNEYIRLLSDKQLNKKFIDSIKKKLIIDELKKYKLTLGVKYKYHTFDLILHMIHKVLFPICHDELPSSSLIDKLFDNFEACIIIDNSLYELYKLFRSICEIFIKKIDELTENMIMSFKKNNQTDLADNTLKVLTSNINYMMADMVSYWSRYRTILMSSNIYLSISKFELQLSDINKMIKINHCTCKKDACRVEKNIECSIKESSRMLVMLMHLWSHENMKNITREMVDICYLMANNSIELIKYLQDMNCQNWIVLWKNCGLGIYNFSTYLEKSYYDDCCNFYSLLCTSLIKFNALTRDLSFFTIINELPLSLIIDRLTRAHYKNEKYREAMITSAVNIFLYHDDINFQGYRIWLNIKYKYANVKNTSVIDCLKTYKSSIEEFIDLPITLDEEKINSINYYEIKILQDGIINFSPLIIKILDDMETIDQFKYVNCVNYLGGHLMKFPNLQSIKIYSTKYDDENGGNDNSTDAILNNLDIDTSSTLFDKLKKIWKYWYDYFHDSENDISKVDKTILNITLKNIITAGEFCRFHHYQNLEIDFWKLAYNLATKLNNNIDIIYIVGRSISSNNIQTKWIDKCENIIKINYNSLNSIIECNAIETIAIFKLSLAEYYYKTERYNIADKLFNEAAELPGVDFNKYLGVYLYSLDISMSYRLFDIEKNNDTQNNYLRLIIKSIYAGATIWIDNFDNKNWTRRQLYFEFDCLFTYLSHVTMRMLNLTTEYEIKTNLVLRLSTPQKLATSLRTVELIKNLCFIDLEVENIDDCQIKLQLIERILKIENFHDNISSNNNNNYNNYWYDEKINNNCKNNYFIEPSRDLPKNDTSPILRKKLFTLPEFIKHDKHCQCFKCTNVYYKFLVFSTTYIHAKLYALQNEYNYSLIFYTGGLNLIRKLIDFTNKNTSYEYFNVIEVVYFLLDYSKLLEKINPGNDNSYDIARQGYLLCEKYKFQCHPVWIAINNWLYELKYVKVLSLNDDNSMINIVDIESSKLTLDVVDETNDKEYYMTPQKNIGNLLAAGRTINLRGKRPVPILTLSKVNSIEISSDDDDDIIDKIDNLKLEKKKINRPIRRKFSESEFIDDKISKEKNTVTKSINKNKKTSNIQTNKIFNDDSSENDFDFPINEQLEKEKNKIIPPLPSRVLKSNTLQVLSSSSSSSTSDKVQNISSNYDTSLEGLIDEATGILIKIKFPDDDSKELVSNKLINLRARDSTKKPAKLRHVEALLMILQNDINNVTNNNRSSRKSKAPEVESLIHKLKEIIENSKSIGSSIVTEKPTQLNDKIESITVRRDKKTSESSVSIESLTDNIEKMSIKSNKNSKILADSRESVGTMASDDEVVESSIIEPRRSRRLLKKSNK